MYLEYCLRGEIGDMKGDFGRDHEILDKCM